VCSTVELISASANQIRLLVTILDLDNGGCLTAGTIFRGTSGVQEVAEGCQVTE
jgi:hypothetical protein